MFGNELVGRNLIFYTRGGHVIKGKVEKATTCGNGTNNFFGAPTKVLVLTGERGRSIFIRQDTIDCIEEIREY